MRRIILLVFFLLFVSSAGFAQQPENDGNTWDFGAIRASDGIVTHTFSLKNDSAQALNINGTHASCGCTLSEIDKKIILPGEAANLEVKFNPKGYSGQITQYVYVNTDSKAMPIYRFTIKADITKDQN
ncbi:MAG: DUF1573 domain-containing protein [Candidatus Omnitrophica bacterium]|nr:DUF1573 domain-containing protein [Candidatus Omnitrophota bacterium]